MISFYPGPSQVHDSIPKYVKDAYKLGIMSINHRSQEFIRMSEKTINLLREKLNIPKNYTIVYTSSATECWEIIAQSLIQEKSYHLYNGAFGEKWFDYTKRLKPGATPITFGIEEKLEPKNLSFGKAGLICITQNETSNGTQVTNAVIRRIKKNNPNHLVAVDATSSMAGVKLDFNCGDVWFASVQKCFGLPAGLAIMICSPQAVKHCEIVNEKAHYNSLTFMLEMMAKWQTPYTPNVLGIYLLMRVMENAKTIKEIESKTISRFKKWETFIHGLHNMHLLVQNKNVRSFTVLPIQADSDILKSIKETAKTHNILLGEGYGNWKGSTFRIANFPALQKKEIEKLMNLLKKIDRQINTNKGMP